MTNSATTISAVNHPNPLLPGLPDHIAHLCLSHVQPSKLHSVCQSWRRLIYSPSFPPFLSIYALLAPSDDYSGESNSVLFSCFDPISSKWVPPPDPPARFLLRHPSFISRTLPIQSVAADGKLVLLAATAEQFQPALSRPLVFCPSSREWSWGPPLGVPRRWCAAGSSAGAVYVASGVGSHYNQDTARSVERWDLREKGRERGRKRQREDCWKRWEKMSGLKDVRFSREAIDAVAWRGKLCMVNVSGDFSKEGIIFDVSSDTWQEMPEGMRRGWRGPAGSMAEETIYVVNEKNGVLSRYDPVKDSWVDVYGSETLKGARYLAAGGGKVCVAGSGAVGIVVVDVTAEPCRVWTVEPPTGFQPVSIHLLPRMSQPEGLIEQC